MMKNIIKTFIAILFCCSTHSILAQIKCEVFYRKYDSLNKDTFHPLPGYDQAPSPKYGYERFFEAISIKSKSLLEDKNEAGKTFVQIIIDTLGNAHCPRIVKSDTESLNSIAIKLIQDMHFVPAKQQGRKVKSTMILPINFGELQEEK